MRRAAAGFAVFARVAVASLMLGGVARAEPVKMIGVITEIELAGKDAKVATVTLEDTKNHKAIRVTIKDDLTLGKLKDHRIVDGDEIRCKYDVKDGKNVATAFFKTAGC
jgi:hypothetical protein